MEYFISDLHLNHININRIDNRGFNDVNEMNSHIISSINKVVAPSDDLYIIGDFGMGHVDDLKLLGEQINGRKHLITGNHDRAKDLFKLNIFTEIVPYKKIRVQDKEFFQYNKKGIIEVILCHYPIAVWDKQHYGSIHIYGHVHGNSHTNPLLDVSTLPNAYNVFCKYLNYTPKTLSQLIEIFGYDTNFYNLN